MGGGYNNYNNMPQNQMYNPMMMNEMMMQQQNYQSMPNMNNNTQNNNELEGGNEIRNGEIDKFVLESLNYYFSEENLNKDSFMRTSMNDDGFIEVTTVASFNRMHKNGVTVEKIEEILKTSETDIETKTIEDKFLLRNKDWSNLKSKLIPIESIQKKNKRPPQTLNKNINFVNYQNNFYCQLPNQIYNPNLMIPHQQMEMNPMMGQNMNNYQNLQMQQQYYNMMMYQNQCMVDPTLMNNMNQLDINKEDQK